MQVYLVGGAVRDHLLQYPVKERDWVVVGATEADMLSQGYIRVGRDFPVFLHPKTREEYALARRERQSGRGYRGFICDASTSVSLEDDLRRRDLTMNAIAMDADGRLIDPYGGLADIQQKQLRHVSPAFVEDPVRILRVARFAARYAHLGFKLAPETRQLMYQMVCQGELAHLVPERVFAEWERALGEQDPDAFITVLRACGALAVILPEIDRLFGVPAALTYHPEIDSGIHTLQVLSATARRTPATEVRMAALLHDVGKGVTPMTLWPKHPDHDIGGVPIIEAIAKRWCLPTRYRQLAVLVSKLHMHIHTIDALSPEAILSVIMAADAFRRPERWQAILLVCEADCAHIDHVYAQKTCWQKAFEAAVSVDPRTFNHLSGQAIADALFKARVAAISSYLSQE